MKPEHKFMFLRWQSSNERATLILKFCSDLSDPLDESLETEQAFTYKAERMFRHYYQAFGDWAYNNARSTFHGSTTEDDIKEDFVLNFAPSVREALCRRFGWRFVVGFYPLKFEGELQVLVFLSKKGAETTNEHLRDLATIAINGYLFQHPQEPLVNKLIAELTFKVLHGREPCESDQPLLDGFTELVATGETLTYATL